MNVRKRVKLHQYFISNYFCGIFRFSSQKTTHTLQKFIWNWKITHNLGQITDRQTPKHHPWNPDVRSVYKRNISLIGENSRNHETKYPQKVKFLKLIRIDFLRGNFCHTLWCSEAGVKSKLFSNFLDTYIYEFSSLMLCSLIILIALILRYHRSTFLTV